MIHVSGAFYTVAEEELGIRKLQNPNIKVYDNLMIKELPVNYNYPITNYPLSGYVPNPNDTFWYYSPFGTSTTV